MNRSTTSCLCGDPVCPRCFPHQSPDVAARERERIAAMGPHSYRVEAQAKFELIYRRACDVDNSGDGTDANDDILHLCSVMLPDDVRARIEQASREG